jgi:hypothetical protein
VQGPLQRLETWSKLTSHISRCVAVFVRYLLVSWIGVELHGHKKGPILLHLPPPLSPLPF